MKHQAYRVKAIAIFACLGTAVLAEGTVPGAPASFTTPGGRKIAVRGGCLIIPVRKGDTTVARDHSWCDRMTPQNPIDRTYAWVPDFLVLAFDNAERAVCKNVIGCVANGRDVEIVLVADGIPNAMVGADATKVNVAVSTGLVDFTEASVVTYLDEIKAQILGKGPVGGLTDWLRQMDTLAGNPCVFHAPSPLRKLDANEFQQIRAAAQTFYEFVMGHELAHARSPRGDCWVGPNPSAMDRELACDGASFASLANTSPPRAMPILVVPPLVAMSHYEHILNGRLGRMVGASTGAPLLDQFPASNWTRRAARFVSVWERHCGSVPENETTCRSGWIGAVADARRVLALPLPSECLEDETSGATAEYAPSAPARLDRALAPDDPACKALEAAILAAPAGFAPIEGGLETSLEDGSKLFKTSVEWPDSQGCSIWTSNEAANYWRCRVMKDSNEAKVNSTFSATAAKVKACLSTGWRFEEKSGGLGRAYYRVLRASSNGTSHEVRVELNRTADSSRTSVTVE